MVTRNCETPRILSIYGKPGNPPLGIDVESPGRWKAGGHTMSLREQEVSTSPIEHEKRGKVPFHSFTFVITTA